MSRTRLTSTLTAFSLAALLAGCGSAGVGDILGGGSGGGSGTDNGGYSTSNVGDNVRGTVERVDTRERVIIVDREDYGSNLRNDGDDDEIALYYDDRTVVQHQGRTYRPQDIEPGDRILADVNQLGGRVMVEEIEVLYDVTSGTGTYDDDDDDRYDDDRVAELRGVVRSVDTRNRTLELETANNGSNSFSTGGAIGGSTRIVEVQYDSQTEVEFEGRRYQPENLERGDLVEIEIRDLGSRLIAEEILVLGENRSVGR